MTAPVVGASSSDEVRQFRLRQDRISASLARASMLGLGGRSVAALGPTGIARLILPALLGAREESWLLAAAFVGLLAPARVPFIPQPAYTGSIFLSAMSLVLRAPNPSPATVTARVVRHAEQAGRATVLDASVRDRRCQGWARVSHGTDCAFCLLLVSRGPKYRSEKSGAFEAHDHDRCSAVPVYDQDDWPGKDQYDDVNALYTDSTKGESDKINAFRRAVYARQDLDVVNKQRRADYAAASEGTST